MERLMTCRVVSTSRDGPRDRGVTVHEGEPLILECDTCGQVWMPGFTRGGRLPRRYWLCPNFGCNHPDRD